MDHDTLQELARQRAQVDLRALKKVIRDHYKLYTTPIEHLRGALEIFELSLDHFVSTCERKTAILERVSRDEVNEYAHELDQVESQCHETQAAIRQLKQRLEEARAERDRRMSYDAVTKTIERFPSREQGAEQLVKLESDIAQLESERSVYADTRKARQDNFDRIVDQLVKMREAIQEEKNEQARRRALEEGNDDDDEDEEEAVKKARREAEVEAERQQDEQIDDESKHRTLDPTAAEFRPAGTHNNEDVEMRDTETSGDNREEKEEGEE